MNVLLDVVDSDREHDTINVLREEVEKVLREDRLAAGGEQPAWTKAHMSEMVQYDSLFRETSRLHAYTNRVLQRKIVADDLVTPDGDAIPQGSYISFLAYPPQVDPNTYPDPLTYNPFRFVRKTSFTSSTTKETDSEKGEGASGHKSFVTTGPGFLFFSHGKHACPGRFMVDAELKIIISQIVSNYELKFPDSYHGKRPPVEWQGGVATPPEHANILFRRRK